MAHNAQEVKFDSINPRQDHSTSSTGTSSPWRSNLEVICAGQQDTTFSTSGRVGPELSSTGRDGPESFSSTRSDPPVSSARRSDEANGGPADRTVDALISSRAMAPGSNARLAIIRTNQGTSLAVIRGPPGDPRTNPAVNRTVPGSQINALVMQSVTASIQQRQRQIKRQANIRRIVVLIFLLVLVIMSVTIGAVLGSRSKSDDESETTTNNGVKPVTVQGAKFYATFLYKDTWNDQMANTRSATFRTYASRLEKLIDEIYSFSPLHDSFNHSKVIRLSEHSGDSIQVTCTLKLKDITKSYIVYPLPPGPDAIEVRDSFLLGSRHMLQYPVVSTSRRRLVAKIMTDTLFVSSSPPTIAPPTVKTTTTVRTSAGTTEELPNVPCGEVRVLPDVRIVGGSEARKGVYPWMVMLLKNTETKNGVFFCGGSILDHWNIITAGHCLKDEPKDYFTGLVNTKQNQITIIAGKHEINTTIYYGQEQRITAQAGYMHSGFSQAPALVNDIAVIRLSRPLQFNSRVTPICLPAVTDPLPPVCIAAGWGTLDHENVELPKTIHTVTLRTYNTTECRRTFQSTFFFLSHSISYYVKDGIVCAANTTFGGEDTCQGDSGGPLFCLQEGTRGEKHYTQFGVVSWGVGCGNPGEPGFYTFVPRYVSWIRNRALPTLDRYSSSQETPDSTCRSFSLLTDYRLTGCRSLLQSLRHDVQCRNITDAVSCVMNALEEYGNHHCRQQDVFNTIITSSAMGLTSQQRRHCQADRPSQPQPGPVCQNQTAVSSALSVCTNNMTCVSMLEVTLCVHSLLDPSWLQCSRQDLQDFLYSRLNASLRICEDHTMRTTRDGRQFMYVDGDWYVLCGDHWGQQEVKVACTHRGFKTGKASYIRKTEDNVYVSDRNTSFDVHHSIKASGWMKVTCSGYESSLGECELVHQASCSSSYLAATVCYNTAYNFTLWSPQPHTDYGYVQLTRDEGQGYVCVPDLSDVAAHQLCREAGYVGGMAYRQTLAPPTSPAVWETEMQCSAGAVDVNGCAHGNWTLLPQTSDSCGLAKVFCFDTKPRLHNGLFNSTGIVQIYRPARNGHDVTLKTVCRQGFGDAEAAILCRQLGFSGNSGSLAFNPFYKPNTEYVKIHCTGRETHLEDCNLWNDSVHVCTEPAVVQCSSPSSGTEPDLSLQLSYPNNEVQVSLDDQWGTICTDHWTDNEAAAICRQLGHLYGYRRFSAFDANPRRELPHVLHNLRCGVNVTSLQQCSFERVASDVCQHERAAAVLCSDISQPVFTLHNPTSSRANEGQVHVNYNGTTAPLRALESNSTASALCQALGYVTGQEASGGSPARSPGVFWWMDSRTNCTDPSEVQQCVQQSLRLVSCTGRRDQDVHCNHPTMSVFCYASAARVHTGALQTTGIVQLYRNGQWWEVCRDDITQSAADVICRDIMGSRTASAIILRDVYQRGSFPTVKVSTFCDPRDPGMTSSDCLVLDLSSKCPAFNNDPASVVCYDGLKPSGAITSWKIDKQYSSRVWVKRYGVWGTVCDDKWLTINAQLLCKHLNYASGYYSTRPFKHDPTTPLWAWSVDCRNIFSYASQLQDCNARLTSDVTGTCVSNLDATVSCTSYDGLG